MDGNEHSVNGVNVSVAFGPDLSHPYIISFGLRANLRLANAIKPFSKIEMAGIRGRVDVIQTHPLMLSRDTESLVTCGIMP